MIEVGANCFLDLKAVSKQSILRDHYVQEVEIYFYSESQRWVVTINVLET